MEIQNREQVAIFKIFLSTRPPMIFSINFAVEGMLRCGGVLSSEVPEAVLRALAEDGIGGARFDARREIFTAEIDPAVVPWSKVREAVRRAGELDGRVLLAVVMSP
ncbi:MAG: hypothetical protein ABSD31_12320 [Candidatus Binataceae bacterium]